MNRCPCCERRLENLMDFPRVFVSRVLIHTPESLPRLEIPSMPFEIGVKKPVVLRGDEISDEVTEFFMKDKNNQVYRTGSEEDGFIYRRKDELYNYIIKSKIVTGSVAKLIKENSALREYLDLLRALEGQEIATERVLPPWHNFGSRWDEIPLSNGWYMPLYSTPHEAPKGICVIELGKIGEGRVGVFDSGNSEQDFQLGQFEYEGRINKVQLS